MYFSKQVPSRSMIALPVRTVYGNAQMKSKREAHSKVVQLVLKRTA